MLLRDAYSGGVKIQITPMLICKIALLACFIPTRGSILGVNSGTLLVVCCFAQMILTRRKVKIPVYYIIYLLSIVACIIYHFETRVPFIHLIQLCQILGSVYVVLTAVRGDKRKFDEIIDYLVVLFAFYGAFGIIESIIKVNIFDVLTGTEVVYEYANGLRFGLARSRGATGTSINNGMMLCLMEGIIAYRLLNAEHKKKIHMVAYILVFVNCFCTLSRGVWLDLAISQILVFFMLRGDKKVLLILKILAVGTVIYILGLIVFPETVSNVTGIFDSMIESLIVSLSGGSNDEIGGLGNRLDLWGWVWISTSDSLLWGKGFNSAFAYLTPQGFIKESIEVMWLYLFYLTGFVGVIGFVFLQIGCIVYSIRNYFKELRNSRYSSRMGFNYIFLVISIAYYVTMFSCAGVADLVFYYFVIGLLFAYNESKETEIFDRNPA